jgi:hypothetical protein
MQDQDGKFVYSNVIKLAKHTVGQIQVFPNPTADFFTMSGLQEGTAVEVLNDHGILMKSIKVSAQSQIINLGNVLKGLYIIRYTSHKEIGMQKIMKM